MHRVTMVTTTQRAFSEAILCHVGQRDDVGYDDDGVDVSVGVSFGAVVGVGVNGQGVSPGVGLGVRFGFPPSHFSRLLRDLGVL